MARDKFEIFLGSNNAPYKVITFISASCLHCMRFYSQNLGNLNKLSKSGQFQIAFFPYIRTDLDVILFANFVAYSNNLAMTFFEHSKLALSKKVKGNRDAFLQNPLVASQLGFTIRRESEVRNFDTIFANLKMVRHIARNNWGISQVPGAVINGYVLKDPTRGKLVRELQKLGR